MSRRDKYPYQLRSLRVPGGVGAAARHDVHKKRRDALAPFFSKRNVLYLEPLIAEKVRELCELILKHAMEETPINLSNSFFAFCNEYDCDNCVLTYHINTKQRDHEFLIC
jgi:hypothetical protein